MQIYMKDGKALWMNEKAITPKKTAAGETWVLNNGRLSGKIDVNINFISNNQNWNEILCIQGKFYTTITYMSGTNHQSVFAGSWVNQAYRTITFLEPPTDELLTWLQNNGVKQ